MTSTNLSTFPAEVLEIIAGFLNASDNGHLRLSCHSVESKVSQGHFRTYFRKKNILFSTASLASFNDMLWPNSLAYLLQDVTFISNLGSGIPPQDLVEIFLAKAFTKLREHVVKLRSINFRILHGHDQVNEGRIGVTARRCSTIEGSFTEAVVFALRESGLIVHDLDLLANAMHHAISIDVIRQLPDLAPLSPVLENVKKFSMGLTQKSWSDHDSDPLSRLNVAAMAHFLEQMQTLEILDLRWFKTHSVTETPEAFFFDTCFKFIPSSALKSCSLRGIYLAEESLRDFLKQTSAKRITLKEIHLQNGTWVSIIDILTMEGGSFEYFHLDDLFEEASRNLIYFKIPGKAKFPREHGDMGPNEIVREGDEVMQKLEYTYARGRSLDSSEERRWNIRRMHFYGNPSGLF